MTTVIRDYRPGDGEGLRALWLVVGFRLVGDDDAGLDRFAERNPALFFVAQDEQGRIVGSTMAAWDGRRGWLYHVATAPDQRRAGLASELVRQGRGRSPGPGLPARPGRRRGVEWAGARVLGRARLRIP